MSSGVDVYLMSHDIMLSNSIQFRTNDRISPFCLADLYPIRYNCHIFCGHSSVFWIPYRSSHDWYCMEYKSAGSMWEVDLTPFGNIVSKGSTRPYVKSTFTLLHPLTISRGFHSSLLYVFSHFLLELSF